MTPGPQVLPCIRRLSQLSNAFRLSCQATLSLLRRAPRVLAHGFASPLPAFVRNESERYLDCGILCRPDDWVRIELKRPFSDGDVEEWLENHTVAIGSDPLSLLCRLAASVPPPNFHLVHYSGVLALLARSRPSLLQVPGAVAQAG